MDQEEFLRQIPSNAIQEERAKGLIDPVASVIESKFDIEPILNRYYLDFDKTQNPVFIWQAYVFYRERGQYPFIIPQWILEYFDMAARAIVGLSNKGDQEKYTDLLKDYNAAICEAVGMKPPGKSGRGNYITKARYRSNYTLYSIEVFSQLRMGSSFNYACEEAGKNKGESKSTMRRAWIKEGHMMALGYDYWLNAQNKSIDDEPLLLKAFEKCERWYQVKHLFRK